MPVTWFHHLGPASFTQNKQFPLSYNHITLVPKMSSRRSRQGANQSRISDDQIIELVSKLKQLLPEIRNSRSNKVSFCFVLLLANVTPLLSIYALKSFAQIYRVFYTTLITTYLLLIVTSILLVWADYISLHPSNIFAHSYRSS